jgi:hypothetical protein
MYYFRTTFHCGRLKNSRNTEVIITTIKEVRILALLVGMINEVAYCSDIKWYDMHSEHHGDRFGFSKVKKEI